MKKKELYIPVNVPDRNDIVPGIGTTELIECGVAFAIGIIAFLIMFFVFQNDIIKSMAVCFAILAAAVVIFRKDKYGENLVFKFQYVLKFYQSQHKYVYKQHNIYEGEVKKNGKAAN